MRKIFFTVVSLLFLFILIRGGAAVLGWGAAPGKDELVVLQGSLPDSLDPARNSSFENALPITGIYEGLVRLNPRTLEPEPCLAESWNVSDDGRRWTFHLKPGIRFSDGTACDAEAVKSSMARSMVLKDTDPYCAFVFNPVSSIETEGRYSVSFVLKYPYAPFIKNLALPFAAPVVSPGALSKYGDEFWKHPSGTGPYMLKEIGRNKIVLQANPLYRGRPAPARRVVIGAVPDSQSRTGYLLDGKADIIFSPGRENLDRLQARGMNIVSVAGIDVGYLGFYTDKPPFNNKYVRMAAAYALDREKIVAAGLGGEGVPAAGLAPPAVMPGKSKGMPKYSPDQVRRILHREGYPAGIDVTLITYQDARRYCPPGGRALAEEIKRQLEPAGIRVTIRSRPWNDHKEAINAKDGHFFLYGWTGDNGDADNFMYTLLASSQAGHGLNASGFKNGSLDIYLNTARRIADAGSRNYLYLQAEEIILDEVPLTAINHSIIRIAHRPAVSDVNLSGFGLIDLYTVKKG
ncbi:MAG: ABC transporter substrate-binding protein [Peptococcaceae bacterium]|nr:ABC transporter substrate-binding protein [Peptococcaceae bacterium]